MEAAGEGGAASAFSALLLQAANRPSAQAAAADIADRAIKRNWEAKSISV